MTKSLSRGLATPIRESLTRRGQILMQRCTSLILTQTTIWKFLTVTVLALRLPSFASPFAVNPVGHDGLCGIGPGGIDSEDQKGKHAIIVFPDNDTNGVLETYGKRVLSVVGEETLGKSPVVAVGHVHKYDPNVTPEHPHYPKSVGHYWSDYSAETPRQAPYPPTLAQYIHMAQDLVAESRALSPGVEKIASGILELARRLGNIGDLKRKTRTHRAIVEVLEGNTAALTTYQGILRRFLVDRTALSENDWPAHVKDIVAVALCPLSGRSGQKRTKRVLGMATRCSFSEKKWIPLHPMILD